MAKNYHRGDIYNFVRPNTPITKALIVSEVTEDSNNVQIITIQDDKSNNTCMGIVVNGEMKYVDYTKVGFTFKDNLTQYIAVISYDEQEDLSERIARNFGWVEKKVVTITKEAPVPEVKTPMVDLEMQIELAKAQTEASVYKEMYMALIKDVV